MSAARIHPFTPAKLLWHRDRIEAMLAGQPSRGPVSLEWDLSNTCNHGCAFCSFGTTESQGYRQQNWQHFPADRALALVPELAAAGVESVTFTGGGEPLMHPRAADIMLAVHHAGIEFGLVTNGRLLFGAAADVVAAHARFVRVSWDAGTEETHQVMHRSPGRELGLIARQMRNVANAAGRRRVGAFTMGASFCVTDRNFTEIGMAADLALVSGAQYLEVRPTFPTEWRGDGWGLALSAVEQARSILADVKRTRHTETFQIIGMVDRFDSVDGEYQKHYSQCRIGALTSVLGAEGTLWHCCVQRGQPEFALASVLRQSFAAAWAEGQAKRLAESIDVKRCPRCRYDGLSEVIDGIEADAFHAKFI